MKTNYIETFQMTPFICYFLSLIYLAENSLVRDSQLFFLQSEQRKILNFLNIEHTDLINPNKRNCILESFYQYIEEEDNTIFTTTYNQFNTAANKWITEYEKSQLKQASKKYNLEECYAKICTVMLKKFPDTRIIPYNELSTYI